MFSATELRTFEPLSIPHIIALVVFVTIGFVLVKYRKQLETFKSTIKWTLFSILLVCVISMQMVLALTGVWDVGDLPLQVCSISTFLAMFLFLKRNDKVFNLLFFIGFIPPILSMISPDLAYQFPHFRFFRYFLQHASITLSVLYFIFYEGYRVPRIAMLHCFIIINIIAVPIYILNVVLGTNFFFLASPTLEAKTVLTFFGSGIKYYIIIEIIAIITIFISYIPMANLLKKERVIDKENQKNLGA